MRTLLVVNPAAGGGRCGRRIDAAVTALRAGGLTVDTVTTTAPGDATALVRDAAADGVTRFVAVGGDGTAFEVVHGLFPWAGEVPPTLGFLPLGTGNSFVRDLGIFDAADAIQRLIAGQTRPVDVLHARCDEGDFHSINLISVGFTADVGELTNRRFKRLGPVGYVAATVARLLTLHADPLPLRRDGGPADSTPTVFLSICNSRCTGGAMQMAPAARIDDGLLDIIRCGSMGRLRLLTAFPRIFRGTHVDMPEIDASTAREVTLDLPDPVDVMIDGEVLRRTLRSVAVLPSAVQVIA